MNKEIKVLTNSRCPKCRKGRLWKTINGIACEFCSYWRGFDK